MSARKRRRKGAPFLTTLMWLAVLVAWLAVAALVFIFSLQSEPAGKMVYLLENAAWLAAAVALLLVLTSFLGRHRIHGALGFSAIMFLALVVHLSLRGKLESYSPRLHEAARRYQDYKSEPVDENAAQTGNANLP